MQNPYGQLIPNGLEDMLTYYGIGINPDLIRDAQCGTIGVIRQSGGYQFQTQVQFPYLPLVSNFLEGNIIVKDLKGVVFQFASSIDTSLAAAKGIKVHPFAFSTTKAGRESGRFAIDPFHQYTAADFPERYIPMAAIFEGSFNSFFVGREPAAKVQESPETRIIAVGSGQFMNDNLGRYRDNMTFFANIVDYLADDKGLISIRAKNSSMADLDETSEKTRRFLKYGNMILPPLLVIVFGLLRWRRRIAFKRTMESQM